MKTTNLILLAALMLTGCVAPNVSDSNKSLPAGVVFSRVVDTENFPDSNKVISVASMPELPRTLQTSLATSAPKSNGVVRLVWDNGNPAETYPVNTTLGVTYPATTAGEMTVGGLPVGTTQTFVVTNSAGSSLPASAVVAADGYALKFQTWLYLTWPGPAGVLQKTTNVTQPGTIWRDVQPIASGGSFLATNQAAQEFYRVRY